MPASTRGYVAGKFALQLDGVSAGFLKSFEGGGVYADVITEPVGAGSFVKKHIGQPRYEDYVLHLGFNLSPVIYDWIAASWNGNYQRKNGSVIATDYALVPQSTREFSDALITETTIPAVDAAAKDAAYLILKFAPGATRYTKSAGKVLGGMAHPKQTLFLPSNFRLEIDKLDCTRVNKIDSFTVKQTVVTDDIGDARDLEREPGRLEFPNLKISLPEVGAQSWLDWFEDFVIRGNNDETREKNGALIFLSPNLKTEVARISFFNLGIFKLTPEKAEANSDAIKRLSAELYCERMEFKIGEKLEGGPNNTVVVTPPNRARKKASG